MIDNNECYDRWNTRFKTWNNSPVERGIHYWRAIQYTGTWPSISVSTANANSGGLSLGVLYRPIGSSPFYNFVFECSGVYTGLSAGFDNFYFGADDEGYIIINNTPYTITSYGSKNIPIYTRTGQIKKAIELKNKGKRIVWSKL